MSSNLSGSTEDVLSYCQQSQLTLSVSIAICVAYFFLLPLLVFVLRIGYRKWREASGTWSHADTFSCHDAIMQLVGVTGFATIFSGIFLRSMTVMSAGMNMFNFTIPGQTLLQVLTCVESYLAVAHPIVYRALKQGGRVRLRNMGLGLVWLSNFALIGLIFSVHINGIIILQACFLSACLGTVSFCSLSVLSILVRPGPGEGGGDGSEGRRRRVDQRKRRAFHTIIAVLVVLCFRFLGILVSGLLLSALLTEKTCAASSGVISLSLPGNLMLPLLFLHRAKKLPSCKCPAPSG